MTILIALFIVATIIVVHEAAIAVIDGIVAACMAEDDASESHNG